MRTTILKAMRLLNLLVSVFINVFGITQPTEATRRRASWFIAALLLLAMAVAGLAFVLAERAFHR